MGAIYDPSEAKGITDSLKQNIETGEEMIDRMLAGSKQLVAAVDGKTLSGAAYKAGKGLFEEVIVPIIDKAKQALSEVKSDLQSLESQINNVKSSPYGRELLDEDVLNQKLEIYRTQQILTSGLISNMQTFGNSHPSGSDLSEAYTDSVNVYTGFLNTIDDDIQKIEDKLRLLAEFDSATNALFTNSEEAFKMVKSAMTVLERTSVDPKTGAYHLPKEIDKSWFIHLDKQLTHNSKKKTKVHKSSLSHFDLNDWLENILGVPSNSLDKAQVLTGFTTHQIWEYIVDSEGIHGGLGSAFKIFKGRGSKFFTAIPIISTMLDYNMEAEKNGKSPEGTAKTKLEVGTHTITNLALDFLTGEGGILFIGSVVSGENYVNSKEDKMVDNIFALGHFIDDNGKKVVSNTFSPGRRTSYKENVNQKAGDWLSWMLGKLNDKN